MSDEKIELEDEVLIDIEKRLILDKLRSPAVIIGLCLLLIWGVAYTLSSGDKKANDVVSAINSEYVNLNAESDSWSCPFVSSGTSDNGNTLIYYNPGSKASDVSLKISDVNGQEVKSEDFQLKANEFKPVRVFNYGANISGSAVVESFGSPIIVYRQISLSDGFDIVPCVRNPENVVELDGLVTKRNTNTTLILNNPHKDSVVVDIKARLFNTDTTPFQVVLDDSKGIVIPPFGRTDIDLQNLFGRYGIINATVIARSGFIAGEAIVDYKTGGDASGQSIVSNSFSNLNEKTSYIFAGTPNSILAQSNTTDTASIETESFASDNRTLNAEAQSLAIGSGSLIVDPGTDFGFHAVKFISSLEKPKTQDTEFQDDNFGKDIKFVSIVSSSASKEGVSTYVASSLKSKDIFIPAFDNDVIAVFNPSNKTAKVKISFMNYPGVEAKEIDMPANSFTSLNLDDYEFDAAKYVQIDIESNREIVASATRKDFAGITPGAYLKK